MKPLVNYDLLRNFVSDLQKGKINELSVPQMSFKIDKQFSIRTLQQAKKIRNQNLQPKRFLNLNHDNTLLYSFGCTDFKINNRPDNLLLLKAENDKK